MGVNPTRIGYANGGIRTLLRLERYALVQGILLWRTHAFVHVC